MARIKQLLSDSLIYSLSSVISRFISFLLLPLYTSILTPEDYGVLNVVNTTVALLIVLAVLSLDSAQGVFFFDSEDPKVRKSVFASWFWCQLCMGVLLFSVLFFLAVPLSQLFFKTTIHAPKFRLASVILLTNILPGLIWNWFKAQRKVWATTIFTLIYSLLSISLSVWFIAVMKWGITGFFLAQIISSGFTSIVSLCYLWNWIGPIHFDKVLLKKMLTFSLPLIPAVLAFWGINSAGGYFVQFFSGEKEVGLFQTGVTIASIMSLVIGAFTQAWGPFAMSIKKQAGAYDFYARIFLIYILVTGLLAVMICVFSPEILSVFTTKTYYPSHYVAGILAFNSLFLGLNYVGALGLNFSKNMKPFAMGVILGSLANMVMYYVGTRFFGKEGTAFATLICNIGVSVFIFRAAQKLHPIPYNFKKGMLIILVCGITAAIGKFIVIADFWESIFIKSLLVLGLVIFLVIMNLQAIKNIFSKTGLVRYWRSK